MNGSVGQMMRRFLLAFALGFSLGMAGFAISAAEKSGQVTHGTAITLWLLLMAASIASPISLLHFVESIEKRRREM